MSVLLGVVVGFLALRVILLVSSEILDAPVLSRRNFRERQVTTAAGIAAVLAVLGVEATRSLLGAFGFGDEPGTNVARTLVLFACVGFGLLGLLDDLLGTDADRGFRGHLLALVHGRLTTGVVKIVGGAALALVLVGAGGNLVSGKRVVADALIVALSANALNLFDRAPGRAIKVGLLAWVPIALVAGTDAVGVAIAPVIGAFVGLAPEDLREHVMLGDTGAYVLGAVLGLAVVLDLGRGPRNGVLLALVLLTLVAEFVSFTRVIDRTPLLRQLDRWGPRSDP
ncbi:MAG TPA: hypothetical protein VFR41_15450 [Acidimicrobiia bacterium]|nr:hypothetical protein [Acidimicrobiia bacterium]